MEPSCKHLSSPTATERTSKALNGADYSINNNNNNNNNGHFSFAHHDQQHQSQRPPLMSKHQPSPTKQALHNGHSSSPPPLSSASSSLSSQSALGSPPIISAAADNHKGAQHQCSPTSSSYNSSFGSSSGRKLLAADAVLVPGGVVTTQNISTVIRPRSNNNSLQFVKIKTPESSIKAVELVRQAEENKISKGRTGREVEEEWQNNLHSWKSKRRQQFSLSTTTNEDGAGGGGYLNSPRESNMFANTGDDTGAANGRKIKTFAEMIEERARSGNRLGFHLQRYIGADGEEEEETGELNGGDRRDKQLTDSSASNSELGAAEPESTTVAHKEPTPPPRTTPSTATQNHHQQQQQPLARKNHPKDSVPECDNSHLVVAGKSAIPLDETDNNTLLHSISLVGHPLDADQLSSTLRNAPDNNNSAAQTSIASQLDEVKAKISNLRATGGNSTDDDDNNDHHDDDDDNDDSVYEEDEEEDEEEHEEQKQLQRIAFEAKLKAFERLTKPPSAAPQPNKQSPLKPKPLPKRTPVANSSVTMQSDRDSRLLELSTGKSQTAEMRLRATVRPAQELQQPEVERVKQLVASRQPAVAAGSEIPPEPLEKQQHHHQHSLPSPTRTTMQQEQQQACIEPLTPSPPVPVQRPLLGNRLNGSSTPPQPQAASQRVVTFEHTIEKSQASIVDTTPVPPPPPPPPSLPHSSIDQVQHRSDPPSAAPQPLLPPPPPPTCQLPLPPPPPPAQPHSIQRNESSSLKSQAPSPRKAPKDDKDRTVLSVSGKKRCSSCKEELGRGAAAFVVESLGLVYHTNCFRCSVCHVNLSNGFRGVDVRVHAGALHCQNCYSKDGLNYSRV